MTTITPYRSPVREGRDGFGQLLHAEWTKFRTVRGWGIGMIVAVLVTAGLGALLAKAASPRTPSGRAACWWRTRSTGSASRSRAMAPSRSGSPR